MADLPLKGVTVPASPPSPIRPRPSEFDGLPVDRSVEQAEAGVVHAEKDFHGSEAQRGFQQVHSGETAIGAAKGNLPPQHPAPVSPSQATPFRNLRGGNRA